MSEWRFTLGASPDDVGFPPPFSEEPHSSNEPSTSKTSMESRERQCLQALPEELLQYIVEHLDNYGLSGFSLAAKWCYELASSVRWREVTLTDCSRTHANSFDSHPDAEVVDDHDDTPLLRKLIVLATNPLLASRVQTVIHRCHLAQPAIFNELPRTTFSGMTLSSDPRTTKLIQLAVQNMTKVHTLRIIFGHVNINDALLRCFFARGRQHVAPVRRLWLENCRISAGCDLRLLDHPLELPLELDFSGLESIRFRRIPLRPGRETNLPTPAELFVHSRSRSAAGVGEMLLQDGAGGHYVTAGNSAHYEMTSVYPIDDTICPGEDRWDEKVYDLFRPSYVFDRQIYQELSQAVTLPDELTNTPVDFLEDYVASGYRGAWLDPADVNEDDHERSRVLLQLQRERSPSSQVAIRLLHSASTTLTSICLDWILTLPLYHNWSTFGKAFPDGEGYAAWVQTYVNFFELRFPNLRALQFRNAVVMETMHPDGLYLLDHSGIKFNDKSGASACLGDNYESKVDLVCLEFMEYHSNLQCLAWPMDGFFSHRRLRSGITQRVHAVVNNLGRTLLDLRVDMLYLGQGERFTDDVPSFTRDRRRHFISDFAAKMTKVESIKIEGGIPRDERREVIRALHQCPLKKIVMIGVCSAVGNTWGAEGRELGERLSQVEVESLEGEDKDVVYQIGYMKPDALRSDFIFRPEYGKSSTPMIHTIAAFHPDTMKELKFCGYKGSPVLFSPAPICQPLLHSLKHFNNLESLILSVWLSTYFEDTPQDEHIISYWLDARSPSSTSLVRVVQDEEPEGWEKELKTKYAPNALAWQITSFIGPFLSEQAKSRRDGVHVRASMCVGDWGGIFDIDLRIGKGSLNSDICLGWEGPREELEPGRRRSKLENRRWF